MMFNCVFLLLIFSCSAFATQKYLLYDVNRGEGFNLQRDVYIRMANTIRLLNKPKEKWTLVLPPWNSLYHWHNPELTKITWGTFFDMYSLNVLIPAIDMKDFLKRKKGTMIDVVYHFSHFSYEGNFSFDFKLEPNRDCSPSSLGYPLKSDGFYHGWFNGFGEQIKAKNVTCMFSLADPQTLQAFLKNEKNDIVYISHAETVANGQFSEWSPEYWTVRRSMIFAANLRDLGDEFRYRFLHSHDIKDNTSPPSKRMDTDEYNWLIPKWPMVPARGGPYLGVHLRRGDFVYNAHANTQLQVPSIEEAVKQILRFCHNYELDIVFVATDGSAEEKRYIKEELSKKEIVTFFYESQNSQRLLTPGELAVIDQWICAHARWFVGTHLSTFTFRIQEERQIIGFTEDSTYQVFCRTADEPCERPARWPVKIENRVHARDQEDPTGFYNVRSDL